MADAVPTGSPDSAPAAVGAGSRSSEKRWPAWSASRMGVSSSPRMPPSCTACFETGAASGGAPTALKRICHAPGELQALFIARPPACASSSPYLHPLDSANMTFEIGPARARKRQKNRADESYCGGRTWTSVSRRALNKAGHGGNWHETGNSRQMRGWDTPLASVGGRGARVGKARPVPQTPRPLPPHPQPPASQHTKR